MKIRMICTAFLFSLSTSALAADTQCFKFDIVDSPEMAVSLTGSHVERWCYQSLPNPIGAYFVFNADEPTVRPELSFVIETDGRMTHGSMLAGQLTVHQLDARSFNPFSVPLKPPHAVTALGNIMDSGLSESATEVLRQLNDEAQPTSSLALEEGEFTVSVPASVLPWRGYWWPYNNAPLYGSSSSPLAKFDRFVKARTGTNPGAQAWERSRHRFKGIFWEGHCNGWAASAILRAQPMTSKYDATSNTTFSVPDQKGILAEKDYCANVAFFGRRYRGNSGDDKRDIYPHVFHRAITYYLGQLGKPVAMDYHRDISVDNHIASGYKMTIKKTGEGVYDVKTVLAMHKYDGSRHTKPGVAPRYTRTYRYKLLTDASGNITGGSWSSGNPDFLWVPLSPTSCSTNNPRVTESSVLSILALPSAGDN